MAHRFSDQEMEAWYEASCYAETDSRQTTAPSTMAKGQSDRSMQRAQDAAQAHKTQNGDEWTSERLSECYNA